MGKTQSKNLNIEETDFNDWQNVGFHRETVEIVKSMRGAGQAQIQNIPFDPKRSLQKQLEIYQYRKDQDNALVHCYGVQTNEHKVSNICGNQKVIKVITERIPKRLPDLPQITFQESLYALSQSLRGYKDCYSKLGPFQITDDMIGVNQNGEVRVWVNEDFGQNHPSMQKPVLQTTSSARNNHFQQLSGNKDQGQMVRNIIQKIEQKCQAGRFPLQFRQRIFKNSYSFDDAYKQTQRFSLQKNLFIPQRILLDKPFKQKESFFTPGDQYVRNQNDPNFRPQRLVLNSKPNQRLQMTRQTIPFTGGYNSASYRSSNESPYTYNYENSGGYGNNNVNYPNGNSNNGGYGNPIGNNLNYGSNRNYGNNVSYGNDITLSNGQTFNRVSSPINTIYRQSREMPLQYNKVVFQSQPYLDRKIDY